MQVFNDTLVYLLSGFQSWVSGITIFPFIFSKVKMRENKSHLNHEQIHLWQEAECLLILYPIIYFGHYGWLRLVKKMDHMAAYKSICFEREAYTNQKDLTYIKKRKLWAWMRHN